MEDLDFETNQLEAEIYKVEGYVQAYKRKNPDVIPAGMPTAPVKDATAAPTAPTEATPTSPVTPVEEEEQQLEDKARSAREEEQERERVVSETIEVLEENRWPMSMSVSNALK